jgi:alpha-tubulin suppressor-like RCC1 family protein
MWVWGQNYKGQLGLNDTTYKSSPVQVGTLTTWKTRSGGQSHYASAIRTDGTLWAWGSNNYGVSGLGDTNSRLSPTQVGALTDWSYIAHRDRAAIALKSDGTLWSWGAAFFGQLGLNDSSTHRSSPVQVGSLTNWKTISTNSVGEGYIGAAIKTDGTLWTWGSNSVGAMGLGNITSYSSPKQVGALTTWYKLATGSSSVAAIKTDGTLWTWGSNGYGKLGLGDTINKNSPVQVGTDSNWAVVGCGVSYVLAVKTDGTLWSWGSNYYTSGQLGLGNTISRSSPTQVGVLTNWLTVSAGNSRSGAIKTDGTLWMWGSDGSGAMGQNATGSDKSSPIQVGSLTTWQLIDVAGNHVGAIST